MSYSKIELEWKQWYTRFVATMATAAMTARTKAATAATLTNKQSRRIERFLNYTTIKWENKFSIFSSGWKRPPFWEFLLISVNLCHTYRLRILFFLSVRLGFFGVCSISGCITFCRTEISLRDIWKSINENHSSGLLWLIN